MPPTSAGVRNAACSCGSGRRSKACCGRKDAKGSSPKQILAKARAHHHAGQFTDAERLYEQILRQSPDHTEALQLMGALALQTERVESAIELLSLATSLNPTLPEALNNLGTALAKVGRKDEAIEAFRRAIAVRPGYAMAWNHLGVVLLDLKEPAEAERCLEQALRLVPRDAETRNNLGNAQFAQQHWEDAIASYTRALKVSPDDPRVCKNLGNTYRVQGQLGRAIEWYQKALRQTPDLVEAGWGLGSALYALGAAEDAICCFEAVLVQHPQHLPTLTDLGAAYKHVGRLTDALVMLVRAVGVDPLCVPARTNLATVLVAQGRVEEAIEIMLKTLELDPTSVPLFSNLLLTMSYSPLYPPARQFEMVREFDHRFGAPLRPTWPTHLNIRVVDRPLRVGYVSGDLRSHAVATALLPILANHDPTQFQIYCYSNSVGADSVTNTLRTHTAGWREFARLSDAEAADLVREDAIDILVDLSNHSAMHRLLVFARKPAPIQATWLGLASTTGLEAMDYRLTDAELDPPGLTERWHTECLVRLPVSAVFTAPSAAPAVSELPARRNGYITFGSFNNIAKVSPHAIETWAGILRAVPDAQLIMSVGAEHEEAHEDLRRRFGRFGVTADRLELFLRVPMEGFLALHQRVDIAFDPFPYNGGTTTFYSLYMGVPIIALEGDHPAARAGRMMLGRVGLGNLAAVDVADYHAVAMGLTNDLDGLAEIRAGLRHRLLNSALMDAPALTLQVERAYRQMWRTWCESREA